MRIDKKSGIDYSGVRRHKCILRTDIYKGKDREEYTWTAARERNRKLRDSFG